MIIAGIYPFNEGEKIIIQKHPHILKEIQEIIDSIDANSYINKESKEKTMPGKMLYSPINLNIAFKKEFIKHGWNTVRIPCDYPTEYYTEKYIPKKITGRPFREMDFIKENLGVEIQLGKYAFMVYNVCAKMTIFNKRGYIDAGVEVVPIKTFADKMSTGVSYFEQFVWDLKERGVSNIDIPVLIYGISP